MSNRPSDIRPSLNGASGRGHSNFAIRGTFWLCANISQRFGVTRTAVENFFRLLGERQVLAEDLDTKLRELAVRHLNLVHQLRRMGASDPEVERLRGEAAAAVGRGEYSAAEAMLRRAREEDLAVEQRLQEQLAQRRASRTETTAALAEAAALGFRYDEAAALFREAADLVPTNEPLRRCQYLDRAVGWPRPREQAG